MLCLKLKGQGQKQRRKELQAQRVSLTQGLPQTLQGEISQVQDTTSIQSLPVPKISEVQSTVQGQIIRQKQSFEMVQVLLHSSVSWHAMN